jgi:hypothetical protein
MTFYSRVDDIVDVAGFTRLTEKVIWQAIENTGLPYEEWTLRKELRDKPVLHLYLEPKGNGQVTAEEVSSAVHAELKSLDMPYAELETFIGLRPFEVTLLPQGTFRGYMLRQQAAGADLAHLKPPHINPSDDMIEWLLKGVERVPVAKEEPVSEAIPGRR